jgi:hypothetical protein
VSKRTAMQQSTSVASIQWWQRPPSRKRTALSHLPFADRHRHSSRVIEQRALRSQNRQLYAGAVSQRPSICKGLITFAARLIAAGDIARTGRTAHTTVHATSETVFEQRNVPEGMARRTLRRPVQVEMNTGERRSPTCQRSLRSY